MKKIIVPEAILNEIINKDLSYIEGDQPYPETEIVVSQPRKNGMTNTSDTFATQAAQYVHQYPSGWYLRENNNDDSLAVLDALNQKGLKQLLINLVHSFTAVNNESQNEVIAVSFKYLCSNIDWSKIDAKFKKEIVKIVGS